MLFLIIYIHNCNIVFFFFFRHLDPTTFGDYPQSMKDAVGSRLPRFTKAQKAKLKDSTDFVGINYYTSFFAKADQKVDSRNPTWATDALVEFERKIRLFRYSLPNTIVHHVK